MPGGRALGAANRRQVVEARRQASAVSVYIGVVCTQPTCSVEAARRSQIICEIFIFIHQLGSVMKAARMHSTRTAPGQLA